VVIIGGGLTGCCVAYACSAAGLKVVLVEADRIGRGASARGEGVARSEPARSFRELEKRLGRRAARSMFDASRRAVLDLTTTARRLSKRLRIEPHDVLRIGGQFALDPALPKEATARADAGLDARWLKGHRASVDAFAATSGAMRTKGWATLDPYALSITFAKAAAARGATIFERTPVRKVRALKRHVEVHTEAGIVTADTVIVCTGEPTDLFRPLKRHFRFAERYLVVTDPLPAAIRKQIFDQLVVTDADVPPHLIRRVGDDRLLIAGADQPRTPARAKDKLLVQRTGQLMYELSRLYPAISGARASSGWDLPSAHSADEVMVAGPHRNYPRHLFAWGTGHDPAQAFLASRIVLRHIQDEATRDDSYFSFTRG
jgi:glycine/D-amino acid oxidase-like deaminating enzyme